MNYGVAWDCASESLIDANEATSTTQCIWANGCTVRRYVMGEGGEWDGEAYANWIDKGFSSWEAVSTDGGRPTPFCGEACNDPSGEGEWFCQQSYEKVCEI